MEFLVNVGHVRSHRFQTDAELVGDFLQHETLHEQIEDLLFSGRKPLGLHHRFFTPMKKLHDLAGDVSRHGRPAVLDFLERIQEFFGHIALDQIAIGPRLQRAENTIVVFVDREHEHQQSRQLGLEAHDTFDAAHLRQIDIHHREGRLEHRSFPQRFLRRAKGPQQTQAFIGANERRQIFPHRAVVFYDDYARSHACSSAVGNGTLSRTCVPAPGVDSTRHVPPTSSMRRAE